MKRKIVKTLTLSLSMLLLLATAAACGKKTDSETVTETAQNAADSDISDDTTLKTEEESSKNQTALSDDVELTDSVLDLSTVKGVAIASGNTGESVELNEADINEIIEKINSIKFTNIESESYTGWEYSIKITYADDSSTDIVITGNEKISCTAGGEDRYYKTEDDIVQLAESYYQKYN